MSNKLRRKVKGNQAPPVRQNVFNAVLQQINQKFYAMNNALLETSYVARYASTGHTHFVEFLDKKGIFVGEEYKEYLKIQNEKTRLAEEIRADEKLSRKKKIAKAKKNDIPEEWVVDPEPVKDEVKVKDKKEKVKNV